MMNRETISVQLIHTGLVEIDKSLMFRDQSRSPFGFTGIGRSIKQHVLVPVSSYLIQHPKGNLLVDTGWNKKVRKQKRQWIRPVAKSYLPDGWAIDEQLKHYGMDSGAIDIVFLSHLDADHAGGLQHVKQAKRFLTHDLEWESAQKNPFRYSKKDWNGLKIETFKENKYSKEFRREYYDVFADGTVLLFFTPGHSKGLSSVIVRNTNGQFVAIVSDVGYAQDSWENMRLPGILHSKKQAVESLAWVKTLSKNEDCLAIFANHDPQINEQRIAL